MRQKVRFGKQMPGCGISRSTRGGCQWITPGEGGSAVQNHEYVGGQKASGFLDHSPGSLTEMPEEGNEKHPKSPEAGPSVVNLAEKKKKGGGTHEEYHGLEEGKLKVKHTFIKKAWVLVAYFHALH